ncbi:hypothetical protein PR202_gb24693 [Eleusine coracana subsp. coracana]|uniref:Auxin-responsive protein n=1 Tax=Eleusine coracana subsp. coracana TaxID=191504 RepID=A0AAV5FN69_ELECO|nr:hypothetical protein PR202_gb24693 [Eleusine coracana subsp. coracana]
MSEGTARSSTESSSAASSGLDSNDPITTLGLGLPGSSSSPDPCRKRASTSDADGARSRPRAPRPTPPPPPSTPLPHVRVLIDSLVGWPPVSRTRQYPAKFVKVAVAGAPYQRKVDLKAYAGYEQLLAALQDKFTSHFTVRKAGNEEMKLVDGASGTEYVPTYEDKDGDWMLVGDVPWR